MTGELSRQSYRGLAKGRRIVVMNPGPLHRGVLLESAYEGRRNVAVHWDDGTMGHPRIDLIELEEVVDAR